MDHPFFSPPPSSSEPYRALRQLFDFAHLPEWKLLLWEWFRATITGSYLQADSTRRESIVTLYERLDQLLEAAHSLHQAHRDAPPRHPGLQVFVDTIRSVAAPAFIFYMGSVSRPSSLLPADRSEGEAHYFLVLLPATASRSMQEYGNMLDNHPQLSRQVCLVKSLAEANRQRRRGQSFFHRFCQEERLLWQAQEARLEETGAEDQEPVSPVFDRWQRQAEGFLVGARHYREEGYPEHAAFLLHQALEHCLTALVCAAARHREGTHHLGKLFRLAQFFAPGAVEVLRPQNEDEEQRYRLLQKAYTAARYQDEFRIGDQDLEWLQDRIGHLHRAARAWSQGLEKGAEGKGTLPMQDQHPSPLPED